MKNRSWNRRRFMGLSLAGSWMAFHPRCRLMASQEIAWHESTMNLISPEAADAGGMQPFRLGVMVDLAQDPDGAIRKVHDLGLPTCFLSTEDDRPELAARTRAALDRYRIEPVAIEALGPGEMVWDFLQGPSTIGLVPRATRQARIDALKRIADFGKKLGIPYLQTHCGFIPEDPHDPLYPELVKAVHEVARHCQGNGQTFLFETGQETPITLLRAIADVGLDNVGVGLDTANLILYGKANPVDALKVFGKYVRTVHAKDGRFPTDPSHLGQEVPIGQGEVNFRRVIQLLRQFNYQGALTIEREIEGPQQIADVKRAKLYLERLVRETTAQ